MIEPLSGTARPVTELTNDPRKSTRSVSRCGTPPLVLQVVSLWLMSQTPTASNPSQDRYGRSAWFVHASIVGAAADTGAATAPSAIADRTRAVALRRMTDPCIGVSLSWASGQRTDAF